MSTKLCFFEVMHLKEVGLKPFLDGINRELFTKSSSAGFLVDRASVNKIEARFIQRIIEKQTVEDPSGGAYQFERISFTEQKFCLRTKRPQLILFDPSSSSLFHHHSSLFVRQTISRFTIRPVVVYPPYLTL